MEIRPVERLILLMLSEIYEELEISGEVDPKFIKGALFGGHDWAFAWQMPGIFEVEVDRKRALDEVSAILEMHSFLEASFDNLSAAEKAKVSMPEYVKFNGFDGNHETSHMAIARFMVEHMGRFTEFAGRDFNSHMATVPRGLRMAAKWREVMDANGHQLMTAEEINQVINAR